MKDSKKLSLALEKHIITDAGSDSCEREISCDKTPDKSVGTPSHPHPLHPSTPCWLTVAVPILSHMYCTGPHTIKNKYFKKM